MPEQIVNAVISFTRFLDRINRLIGNWFVAWLLFAIMGVIIFEVVTRRFLGTPQIWTQEIIAYLFCSNFLLALGYTLHYKEHVIADVLTSLLPEKVQVALETVAYLLFVGVFLYVMLPTAMDFTARAWAYGERAATSFNSPVYLVKTLVPIGLVLLAIQLVAIVLKNGIYLTTGRRIED